MNQPTDTTLVGPALPGARSVRVASAQALAYAAAADRQIRRTGDCRHDDFEPDNGAPVLPRAECSCCASAISGEGAIYSPEYLSRKYGRAEA